jgi:two-component system CheB/CheR fusion protein
MKNRQHTVVPDIYADSRIPHEAYRPTFVHSLLMVPVRVEDPVGAIGVYWASNHEATTAEVELTQAIANGASLALANVALYQELQLAVERERRARLAAEEANRLMDQFLATVSHELRTPLGVIQGWLWQMRQPQATPEIKQHALMVLERNAALQAHLVENLLDASRALAGKLHLRRNEVDLPALCATAVNAEQPAADAKNIDLRLDADAAPITLLGDRDRLWQVVRHLVGNAVKFTPAGGTVRVRLEAVEGRARITVRDNGIGISAEFLPMVFERFRQADGSMTRRYGGLGLGLTIVRHLVELHGGSVAAASEGQGHGTTMIVELPLAPVSRDLAGAGADAPVSRLPHDAPDSVLVAR